MSIKITTGSLKALNTCNGSIEYFTGSFCIEGKPWYSSSNNECYFEKNIVYPVTCSNAIEIGWMLWAADTFLITGSFHNLETKVSNDYYRI